MSTDTDLHHLHAAIALGVEARRRGDGPFGARVVGADGRVLAESGNLVGSDGDATAHAEVSALRRLGIGWTVEEMRSATMYASAEPCAMCAAAIAWQGIGRVVFAVDGATVRRLDGPAPTAPGLDGREVLTRSGIAAEHREDVAREAAGRLWPAVGSEADLGSE